MTVTAETAAEAAKTVKANGGKPPHAATLAEAVCRVMEQVGYVQKDKQMQGGGSYKYVSVEAVIDALRPEMIRQQLVLLPAGMDPITIETFENKNGTRQNRTQVKYTFKMLHAPSGEAEEIVVIGEAIDVGDKSSNKAMTAARKYALIMAFNIETGIDPDDTPSHTQERAAPVQQPRPQAATNGQPVDNLRVRAKMVQAFAQCESEGDYRDVVRNIQADLKSLSAADKEAVTAAVRETKARLGIVERPQPVTA